MNFHYFKQADSMDCGPSCLRMIGRYYGKSYSLQSLRSKSFITKSGVSMLGISDATESIGFRTRGYEGRGPKAGAQDTEQELNGPNYTNASRGEQAGSWEQGSKKHKAQGTEQVKL